MEPSEDEDFEEEKRDDYLVQVLEGETVWVRRPRAHLAIVALGGDQENALGVAVQGIGRPLTKDFRVPIADKARLLKSLGQEVLSKYNNELHQLLGGKAVNIVGSLVQTRLAESLSQSTGQESRRTKTTSTDTWRTRISKAVKNEWVELPDGQVVPLGMFFRSCSGPVAKEEEPEMLQLLSEHPTWNPTKLARAYLERCGVPPGQPKVEERYRKAFERLKKGLLQLVRSAPQKGDRQLAERYLARRGLLANQAAKQALIESVVQIFQAFRGKDGWPEKGRNRKGKNQRTG